MTFLAMALMIGGIAMPPAKYDHEPRRPYSVHYVDQMTANQVCASKLREAARGSNIWGCAVPLMNTIFVLETLPPNKRKLVLRHERGHLNGWKHR